MKIHIGQKIEEIVREKGVKHSWLALKMHLNRRTLYDIYEKEDINTSQLRKFSEVLNHNFFQYLNEQNMANEPQNAYANKPLTITIDLDDPDDIDVDRDELTEMIQAMAKSYIETKKKKRK